MTSRDKVIQVLLYCVLAVLSFGYKLLGRRFLDTEYDPGVDSYYQRLPDEHNYFDEY